MTLQLTFTVPQARADALAEGLAVLDDLVFDRAAAPDGGVDLARIDPSYPIVCVLYFEDEPQATRARALIEGIAMMRGWDAPAMTLSECEDADWVTLTQASLPAVEVGQFYMRGGHCDPAPAGLHDLLVEAGLAFGTGHHETTRGCLQLFSDMLAKQAAPQRVLDMGCGTGVLAMAAAKVGVGDIVGIELDGDSVEVAKENARLNDCAGAIAFCHGGTPDLAGGAYDLIFANILAGPLIELAPGLTEVAQPGGDLLLAGLLVEQEARVLATYQDLGWQQVGGFHDRQWALVHLRKAA